MHSETMRSKKAAETRTALLRAASQLFAEYGFDRVTVEDITRAAGFSKGTFYSHFSAKEAILSEQFRQLDVRYQEVCNSFPDTIHTGQKILRIVDTMCAFCEDECGLECMRVVCANQLLHNNPDVNIMNNSDRGIYKVLRVIAKEGKERGELPEDLDDDIFASEVVHVAHGILYDWCMRDGAFGLKEEGRRIFEHVISLAATGGL